MITTEDRRACVHCGSEEVTLDGRSRDVWRCAACGQVFRSSHQPWTRRPRSFRLIVWRTALVSALLAVGIGALAGGSYLLRQQFGRWEPPDLRTTEAAIARDVNEFRVRQGQEAARYSRLVATFALNHSADMAGMKAVAHEGPHGQTVHDRFSPLGLSCVESVATLPVAHGGIIRFVGGETSKPDAMPANAEGLAGLLFKAWQSSPEHSDRMLRSNTSLLGAGIVIEHGVVYATLDLCSP